MALAYIPPGVSVEELASPSIAPFIASPATVCLIGEASGYIQRTDIVQLANEDSIALPNFPREVASMISPVISVTNLNEVNPYDAGNYEVNYNAAVNEVQQLTVAGATGGDYTLTFGEETTAAIDFDDNAAAIELALEALSNIDTGEATVAGAGPFTITFSGQYANANVPQITADAAGLTGTTPTASVRTVVEGGIKGTIKRVGGGDIPEGATVSVVYRYRPDDYFYPTRLDQSSIIEERYGPAYNSNGSINSPLALAANVALENGARDVVVQPLFKRTTANDPNSVPLPPAATDIESATTWEQTLYSLRNIEDINIIVPVIGQSHPGLSDDEQISILRKVQDHIKFMKDNQEYIISVVGEDSTASSSSASQATIRAHAAELASRYGRDVGEAIVFVAPSKFTRINPRTSQKFYVGGQYVAAGVAGMLAARRVADSVTREVLSGFYEVVSGPTSYSRADKNADAQAGLTVVEQVGNTVQIRHAVTLDNSSVARREVSVVRAKHRMVESVAKTIDQNIIGKVIADGDAPVVVASTVEGVLEKLVQIKDIVGYSNIQARTLNQDPTTVEVRFSYRPAFPLNYVNVIFSLDLTSGEVDVETI